MNQSEKEKNFTNSLADFEDEVSRRIENGTESEIDEIPVTPAATIDLMNEPEPVAPAAEPEAAKPIEIEPAPAVESAPVVNAEPEPTVEVPAAPEEVREEPTYGAPQPLDEDLLPSDLIRSEEERRAAAERADKAAAAVAAREAKEAEAERRKAEKEAAKEAAKEAKRQAKADKKKAKTAALIARVESEAEQNAIKEIEKETGEHYEPAPAQQAAEQAAPADAPVVAALPVEETPKEEEKKPRKYSSYERKLRRKYKLDKDKLLSENDAVPGFIIAKGETVIRSYNCLSTGKGDGILCLTNKRLLINAGERSEIAIDKVSGIKFSKYGRFSFGKFLFWLIFFGLGAFMLMLPSFNSGMNIPGITGESWKDWFTILFYVCGGISVLISLPFFFTMVRKTFYFYVYAREEAPFLEYKSRSYARREKKGKVYKYMVSKAGKESEKAARELGALIIEAKEGRYDE